MLTMKDFSTHSNGVCATEHKQICSFSYSIYNDMISNITIGNVKDVNFLENFELIKTDFCEFLDNVAELLRGNGVELPNNDELPSHQEGPMISEENQEPVDDDQEFIEE